MLNQSSFALHRSPIKCKASPPSTLNFLFPKPLYRKLSQHPKDSLRGLSHLHSHETSCKKTHCATDRTLSPYSFLSIGREERSRSRLTLLFQQRAIVPVNSQFRLREISALAVDSKREKLLDSRLHSPQKHRPLRQHSLHAFNVLTRTEKGAKGTIRRKTTILPSLNRPETPGESLGPW